MKNASFETNECLRKFTFLWKSTNSIAISLLIRIGTIITSKPQNNSPQRVNGMLFMMQQVSNAMGHIERNYTCNRIKDKLYKYLLLVSITNRSFIMDTHTRQGKIFLWSFDWRFRRHCLKLLTKAIFPWKISKILNWKSSTIIQVRKFSTDKILFSTIEGKDKSF